MAHSKDQFAFDKTATLANAFAPIAVPVAAKRSQAANPFASRPAATVAASSAPTASSTDDYYAIVASGPAIAVGEVESNVPAIEVMVLWGERDILHVSHLSPPRPFVVGDSRQSEKDSPDFAMDGEFLGAERLTVAMPEGNGVAVLVPSGATISVRCGKEVRTDAMLREGGELRASSALAAAMQYTLRQTEVARVDYKGFVFQVKAVAAGLPLATKVRPDARPLYYVGGVGALVSSMFLAMNFLLPPPSVLGGDQLDLDNRYVTALIERREVPLPPPTPVSSNDPAATQAGQAASGDPGQMGDRNRPHTTGRAANAGDASARNIAPTSSAGRAENNPMTSAIATIATMFGSGASSDYTHSAAIGSDPMTMLANLVGGTIQSSGGNGGLGPNGSGLGGGGTGTDTVGPAHGLETHGGSEYVTHAPGGNGDPLPPRGPARPGVHFLPPEPSGGGLTSDQIRHVIQRNIPQVQHCYEQGLSRNPSLAGRVTVSFMITPSGAVGSSTAADNSLGDAAVGQCIASSVRRWSFPQPNPAGPVSVRFPFNLSQSGQ